MYKRNGILPGKQYSGWTWALHLSHSAQLSHNRGVYVSHYTNSVTITAGDRLLCMILFYKIVIRHEHWDSHGPCTSHIGQVQWGEMGNDDHAGGDSCIIELQEHSSSEGLSGIGFLGWITPPDATSMSHLHTGSLWGGLHMLR